MKKCTVGLFSKIVVLLLFAAFLLPMTGLFLYLVIFDPSLSLGDRSLFAAGAILFGGLIVFAAYRVLYRGIGWVEYDKDTVIFHCSRREEYRFLWGDLPGDRVKIGPWQGGYMFIILADGRQKKVGFNRSASGFKALERTMEEAGVLKRIGVMTKKDCEQAAEQMFEQFEKYKEAHPGSVRPKPEGDCVLCPDCDGKGIIFKKVLKLDVGKVCKTCGGSGYVPR